MEGGSRSSDAKTTAAVEALLHSLAARAALLQKLTQVRFGAGLPASDKRHWQMSIFAATLAVAIGLSVAAFRMQAMKSL